MIGTIKSDQSLVVVSGSMEIQRLGGSEPRSIWGTHVAYIFVCLFDGELVGARFREFPTHLID